MSTPHAARLHAHRPHVRLWPVTLIGLAIALVAVSAWAYAQRGDGRSQDAALVAQVIAAWNARDAEAIGRLYTADAVLTSGIEDPGIVGREKIQQLASRYWNTIVPLAEPTTLVEPAGGFSKLTQGADPHYVLQPVLIHDDVSLGLFEVRGGKIATHLLFEPFEPARR